MPVTFAVASGKSPSSYEPDKTSVRKYVQDAYNGHFDKNGPIRPVLASSSNEENVIPRFDNGLLGTAYLAYCHHYNLVLTPDDVWINFLTVLAGLIDRNAETMRHLFVTHEGQKQLSLKVRAESVYDIDYDKFIVEMCKQIDQNVISEMNEWATCDFTTSTHRTRIVSKLLLMGGMKNYFTYKCYTDCGIPYVTLGGTVEDWIKIRNKIQVVAGWHEDLGKWIPILTYVLDRFLEAFYGTVDINNFWGKMCDGKMAFGSGTSSLSGWILAFSPFNDEGKYILNSYDKIKKTGQYGDLDTESIPSGMITIPVTIVVGSTYKGMFVAGNLMTKQVDPNTWGVTADYVLLDVTK